MPEITSVTVNYEDGSSATFTAQDAEPVLGAGPVVGEGVTSPDEGEGVSEVTEPSEDEAPNPAGNVEQL